MEYTKLGSTGLYVSRLCLRMMNFGCTTQKQEAFRIMDAAQEQYTLHNRLPELEVLPACRELGIGFTPWGPLAGGLLAGKSKDSGRRKALSQTALALSERYGELCREAGMKEAEVALLWLLQNPTVTAPVIGARTLEQFEKTLRALETKLPEDLLRELDTVFPGPGEEAPEAYAW